MATKWNPCPEPTCPSCDALLSETTSDECESCALQVCESCIVSCVACGAKGCKCCFIYSIELGEWFCDSTGPNRPSKSQSDCLDKTLEEEKEKEKQERNAELFGDEYGGV